MASDERLAIPPDVGPDSDFSRILWARAQTTGDSRAKLVLMMVALRANDDALAFYSDKTKIAAEAEMTTVTVKRIMNRLAFGEWLVSVPLANRDDGQQSDNLYILNPGGWLSACTSADDIVARVSARMDAYHGRRGNSPIPAWAILAKTGNGLRTKAPKIPPKK